MKMSICRLVVVLGCLAGSDMAVHAAPSAPLYIVDSSGNLGTINIATQSVSVIGATGVGPTDVAFTSDGTLYATSFTSLYQLNQTTAAATLLGSYGGSINSINALVGAPGGGLYAAANGDTTLYSVTTAPFTVTALSGSTGGNSSGDLASSATGTSLYETQTNGDLYQLSFSGPGIVSTLVGNTGRGDIYGLATGDDGVTYALAGTGVYAVNTATAGLTLLFDYGGHGLTAAYGTAFLAESRAVPEPASMALLGVGLLGIGAIRRRRGSASASVA